jgi:hypothetical protein
MYDVYRSSSCLLNNIYQLRLSIDHFRFEVSICLKLVLLEYGHIFRLRDQKSHNLLRILLHLYTFYTHFIQSSMQPFT